MRIFIRFSLRLASNIRNRKISVKMNTKNKSNKNPQIFRTILCDETFFMHHVDRKDCRRREFFGPFHKSIIYRPQPIQPFYEKWFVQLEEMILFSLLLFFFFLNKLQQKPFTCYLLKCVNLFKLCLKHEAFQKELKFSAWSCFDCLGGYFNT